MFLSEPEQILFKKLLISFFSLPYSTDLDGKDAETLIRLAKGINGTISRRKELFDIIGEDIGYSVKTLSKTPRIQRLDIQEQRLGDVTLIRALRATEADTAAEQGKILLNYMKTRIEQQMRLRNVTEAKSLVLLKHWNPEKTKFSFRYWEEDFFGYVNDLHNKNERGEIEWLVQDAGLHGRDRLKQNANGTNVRLIRMHYKHNQIFTDHDIPSDTVKIDFELRRLTYLELVEILSKEIPM